jgi:predicted dehydrogenase/NADPH:quinone reductase-like Zn-dependent oxidoreductase
VKQILQSARTGELRLVEVPAPALAPGQVLVQNHKVRQEGPLPTYRTVVNRLDSPQPLGYSCAGVVRSVADDVTEFAPGDRVACAGAGYANHAELITVPANLVAQVPDGLSLERAAYATLGSIAMQGLRIAEPSLGEVVVVVGLGLIGQLAVQLLTANGCRVLGVDIDERRIKQALDQGAEWGATPDSLSSGWSHPATDGLGVDFAVVAASSESAAPIALSANLCRPKGRVVVIGAVPLELDRRTFYEKELELRLSMSYGPGRYDRRYEELGLDYPLPYVRWTENRNLQAFLALAASGSIHPEQLDAETVAFEQAEAAYEELASGERKSLAVIFQYADAPTDVRSVELRPAAERKAKSELGIGFLGAGNYAKAVLLPALASEKGLQRVSLVTATGPSAMRTAERFEFSRCGTDPAEVIEDPAVDLLFIATRHDVHAPQVSAALRAGKAVWLEKPLGLAPEQVAQVAEAARESEGFLAVGYNRRFSAHAKSIRDAFADRSTPLSIQYTVAAGPPPAGTWVTDPGEGGGRIIGECCHFIDLCTYLVGALPVRAFAQRLGSDPERDDSTVALLSYADGSSVVLQYLAGASTELSKERFEVSAGGLTAICDNFKQTRFTGAHSPRDVKQINQDKGQATAIKEVLSALRQGGAAPFTLEELLSTSLATFAIQESIRRGEAVDLDALGEQDAT